MKIVAEARSFAAVLDYLRELQGQASLRDVMLQHHQVDAQDPEQPVRFSVTATWEEQP
ncbi:MAG: PilN domain-containing protein [Rhodocyclales bacterium]|nr:PilN domain-containing protein [Rhodocyclales bacterium]